eukprot:SAG31_NODE_2989_length_4813_cov_8.205346_5_plen_103_part_00
MLTRSTGRSKREVDDIIQPSHVPIYGAATRQLRGRCALRKAPKKHRKSKVSFSSSQRRLLENDIAHRGHFRGAQHHLNSEVIAHIEHKTPNSSDQDTVACIK